MITRDGEGRVILIETPTAIVREKSGVWYLVLDDGLGIDHPSSQSSRSSLSPTTC